jgi:hypothetical protein
MKTISIETLNRNSRSFRTVRFSQEIVETVIGLNTVQTAAGNVSARFGANYVNTAKGSHGLIALISEILREHGAEFSVDAVQGNRELAIVGGMLTDDILAEVESRFSAGTSTYPVQSVRDYLSTHGKKVFGKIRMTSDEDSNRPCRTTRNRWFLKIENN